MSNQMNWRKAKLASKPSLDHRWDDSGSEFSPDRASRWLQAVERRLRERTSPRRPRWIVVEPVKACVFKRA